MKCTYMYVLYICFADLFIYFNVYNNNSVESSFVGIDFCTEKFVKINVFV